MTPPQLLVDVAASVLVFSGLPVSAAEDAGVEVAFTFDDPGIDESSGLVSLGRTVLTVNDSGDGPVVYAVDADTGRTVGRTTYTTDEVVDVEAMAEGPDGSVWVGDIGDNSAHRMSVAVYRLPPVGRGDRTVTAQRYDLSYAGGPRDAEALLVHPTTGRLYVVSKGLLGGQVYAAPAALRAGEPNLLRPVGRAAGLVTDGAFLPDGEQVVLRTYSSAALHDSRDWRSRGTMGLPRQSQGEGVAVVVGGRRLLLSSEGSRSEVLSVPLSPRLQRVLEGGSGQEPAGPAAPDPSEPVAERFWGEGDWIRLATLAGVVVGAGLVVRLLFRGARPRSRWRR